MANEIRVGDTVRSFDFESHDVEGSRACYVEGRVTAITEHDDNGNPWGCPRYRIEVTRCVFGGEPRERHAAVVFPPVNGTPTLMGDVCNSVERIAASFPGTEA